MRIAYWDSGDPEMHFDNPNLIWGDPSFLREPGDPGYVDPFPSVNQTKTKNKRMKHNSYYPIRQGDQITWLVNHSEKIVLHGAALGLSPAQIAAIVADCKWLIYVMQAWLAAIRTFSLAGTDAVAEAQTGTGGVAQVLPVFPVPELPAGTVAVLPGALTRIFAAVQQIKASGKCTDVMASDLGIVGSEATPPDLATVQPVISAKVSGSEVGLRWNWGGNAAWLDACELQVDRGDGKGYVLLALDTTPDYTDTQPFPAAKTVWSYRAIYRVDAKQVGLWSQPVSVTVGG